MDSFSSQFKISFDYTPYGEMRAVNQTTAGPPIQIWQNTARNAFDEITAEECVNGAATTRQFDARGRLTSVRTTLTGKPIQDLGYQYDANGNLTARTNGIAHVVESFRYDPLDRLRRWEVNKNDRPDLTQQFDYDDIGNLKSRTTLLGNGGTFIYGYSQVHAGPHAVTSVNNLSYAYDAAGREKKAPGRQSKYLSWGLPTRIEGKHFTDHFKYDFEQQRVLKTRSDGTTIVTLDGLFEHVSRSKHRGSEVYYIPGLTRIIALRLQHVNDDKGNLYVHSDRLGSVVALTQNQGSDPEVRTYDPFGTTREANDPSRPASRFSSEPLGFTERELDSEVGLLNMLGRLYDPKIGRFVSPDPLTEDTLSSQSYNRYSYVNNNPLRWTDPTGRECVVEGCAIANPPLSPPPLVNAPELPAPPLVDAPALPAPSVPPLVSAGIPDDTGLNPLLPSAADPLPMQQALSRPAAGEPFGPVGPMPTPLGLWTGVVPPIPDIHLSWSGFWRGAVNEYVSALIWSTPGLAPNMWLLDRAFGVKNQLHLPEPVVFGTHNDIDIGPPSAMRA